MEHARWYTSFFTTQVPGSFEHVELVTLHRFGTEESVWLRCLWWGGMGLNSKDCVDTVIFVRILCHTACMKYKYQPLVSGVATLILLPSDILQWTGASFSLPDGNLSHKEALVIQLIVILSPVWSNRRDVLSSHGPIPSRGNLWTIFEKNINLIMEIQYSK